MDAERLGQCAVVLVFVLIIRFLGLPMHPYACTERCGEEQKKQPGHGHKSFRQRGVFCQVWMRKRMKQIEQERSGEHRSKKLARRGPRASPEVKRQSVGDGIMLEGYSFTRREVTQPIVEIGGCRLKPLVCSRRSLQIVLDPRASR